MNDSTTVSELNLPATVTFPTGIPGFESLTTYRLTHSETEVGYVFRLRAEADAEVEFTLVDPRLYALNYVLELDDAEQAQLQADDPTEIMVLLMVWKDASAPAAQGLNANIGGPILINIEKGLGIQKLIDQPRFEFSDEPHAECSISN